MNNQLQNYFTLKTSLKAQSKTLKELLMEDGEYNTFQADLVASREVLTNCRNNLIKDSPSIGAQHAKVVKCREELKVVKEALKESCKVVDSMTGEQLSLNISF